MIVRVTEAPAVTNVCVSIRWMALFSAGLLLITIGLSVITPIPSLTPNLNFVALWGLGVAGLTVLLEHSTSSERLLSSIPLYSIGAYLKLLLLLLSACPGS